MTRIAFLGPRATFTEQALRSMPEAAGAELVPSTGSSTVLAAVRDGTADLGCVPIENSVEGAVPAVLDGLVADPPLVILREAMLAVRFALVVRAGTRLADRVVRLFRSGRRATFGSARRARRVRRDHRRTGRGRQCRTRARADRRSCR